jgi:hypothetical protein
MIYARRTAHHQAVFVMIEFRFVDPKRRLSFHVTTIDRVKDLVVNREIV